MQKALDGDMDAEIACEQKFMKYLCESCTAHPYECDYCLDLYEYKSSKERIFDQEKNNE